MTEDAVVAFDESAPSASGPAVEEPIRHDAEGNPVYGEWDENDLSTEIVYQPPEEVRTEMQRTWNDFRSRMVANRFDEASLLDGVEKVYSTSKAAAFFGRSNQWMYWGLRNGIFTYKDGSPILPERIGRNGRRRFNLPIIREIALSCYRRGNISEEELEAIMAKVLVAEFGKRAFADTN